MSRKDISGIIFSFLLCPTPLFPNWNPPACITSFASCLRCPDWRKQETWGFCLLSLSVILNELWACHYADPKCRSKVCAVCLSKWLHFICLEADGNWVILLLHHPLLCCFPQPWLLFSYHQITGECRQSYPKTSRAMPCTTHCTGRGYLLFNFR